MTSKEWIEENGMFISANSFRPALIVSVAFNAGLEIGKRQGLEESLTLCENEQAEFPDCKEESAYNSGVCDCMSAIRARTKGDDNG